jgi:hypothetical protein
MGPLGTVRNAAGFDDVAKQAEVGQIKSHREAQTFVFCEVSLPKRLIVTAYLNANLSFNTKQPGVPV